MEIVRERLEREFDLSLIATAPSVAYRAYLDDATMVDVDNPSELPDPSSLDHVDEPMLSATILTPAEYTGAVMELCQGRRAEMVKMEYLSPERVEFVYSLPLAEVVVNFFDQLKSRTKGYASLDYEPDGYATADLVKVDLLINHTPVDAFSTIVHRSQADVYGQGPAKGRAGQVLRRGHHPQAQAPREAEGGQEEDEEHRPGGSPPGGLRLGPPARRLRRTAPAPIRESAH
jgi:GTP-binding protein LepA